MSDRKETFGQRLTRLAAEAKVSDAEMGAICGVSEMQARRYRLGDTLSIKFDAGLRLATRMAVSPYYLAGEAEPEWWQPRGSASLATVATGASPPLVFTEAQRAEIRAIVTEVLAEQYTPARGDDILRVINHLTERLDRVLAERQDAYEARLNQPGSPRDLRVSDAK